MAVSACIALVVAMRSGQKTKLDSGVIERQPQAPGAQISPDQPCLDISNRGAPVYYIVENGAGVSTGSADDGGTVIVAPFGAGDEIAATFRDHNGILRSLGQPEVVVVLIRLPPVVS